MWPRRGRSSVRWFALAATLTAAAMTAQAQVTRVSVSSSGAEANGRSFAPSISADGRYVAFLSDATNLVPGDTNGVTDAFLRDRLTGMTRRVSVTPDGAQVDNHVANAMISANGRIVAFESCPADWLEHGCSFLHDVTTRVTSRVLRPAGHTRVIRIEGITADARWVYYREPDLYGPGFSDDRIERYDRSSGRFEGVAGIVIERHRPCDTYFSYANFSSDVALATSSGALAYWTTESARYEPFTCELFIASESTPIEILATPAILPALAFSGDGRFLAIGGVNLFDTVSRTRTDELQRVLGAVAPNGNSWTGSLNLDGRYAAFVSSASNLVAGDTNDADDLFVLDRVLGRVDRVGERPSPFPLDRDRPAISSNGRYVAYTSDAGLVTEDLNAVSDIYVAGHFADAERFEPNNSAAAATRTPRWTLEPALCLPSPFPLPTYPDAGGRCPGVYEDLVVTRPVPPVSAADRWRARETNLSLHNAADRDFFRLTLPNPSAYAQTKDIRPLADRLRDPTRPVPLPDCAMLTRLDLGGGRINVAVSGRLEIVAIPTTNAVARFPLEAGDNEIRVYRPGSATPFDVRGDPALHKTIACPKAALGLSDVVLSLGKRDTLARMDAAGGYSLEVAYTVQGHRLVPDWVMAVLNAQGMNTILDIPCQTGPVGFAPGSSYPNCNANFSNRVRFDVEHPIAPRFNNCIADGPGCFEPVLVQWPATTRPLDLTLTADARFEFQLYNANRQLIARSTPCPTCSAPAGRAAFRMQASVLLPGLYVMTVKGPPGPYGLDFAPLPKQ